MSFDEVDRLLGEPGRRPAPEPAVRPSVLVVDDNRQVLRAVQRILSLFYDVTIAASALEALEVIRPTHAAVLLDVRMPTFDGFWASNRIREKYPDIPVIFHTAYQSEKAPEVIEAEHKPFAYLLKDGDVDRLLSTVAAAVARKRGTE